jgi:hypothetical protein
VCTLTIRTPPSSSTGSRTGSETSEWSRCLTLPRALVGDDHSATWSRSPFGLVWCAFSRTPSLGGETHHSHVLRRLVPKPTIRTCSRRWVPKPTIRTCSSLGAETCHSRGPRASFVIVCFHFSSLFSCSFLFQCGCCMFRYGCLFRDLLSKRKRVTLNAVSGVSAESLGRPYRTTRRDWATYF